jgi:hypothetical protein
MEDMRFADVMRRERERLNREREEILGRQTELANKLDEINREVAAIEAYETAKTGKAATSTRQRRATEKSRPSTPQSSAEVRPRPARAGRREELLQVISAEPNGLSRGQIFERMAIKGDKTAEKSVSNALTALTKNNRVSRRDGRYVIGG